MSATCQTQVAFGGGNGEAPHLGLCGKPATETGPWGAWCAEHIPIPDATVEATAKALLEQFDRCREIDDLKARLSRAEDHIARLTAASGRLAAATDQRFVEVEDRIFCVVCKSNVRLASSAFCHIHQPPVNHEDPPPAPVAGQFYACPSCGVKFATTEAKMAHYDAGCETARAAVMGLTACNRRRWLPTAARLFAGAAAAAGLVALGSLAWQHATGLRTWVGF